MDAASLSKSRWLRLVAVIVEHRPRGVARAARPISAQRTKSFLRQARENPDPNIRYVAYAKLGSPAIYENTAQKDEAVKILVAKLEEAKSRWLSVRPSCEAWATWAIDRARRAIMKAVNDNDNAVIRVEACRALGKVGLPEDATTLARIMTIDKLEDCRIAAIEAIGLLKAKDPRIYQILLDGMDNDDPAIRLECLRSLRKITDKDFGIDPAAWKRELEPAIAAMSRASSPSQAVLPQSVVRSAPPLR